MIFTIKLEEVEAMQIWNAILKRPAEEILLGLRALDRQLTAQGAFEVKPANGPGPIGDGG